MTRRKRKKSQRKKRWRRRLLKWSLLALLAVVVMMCLFTGLVYIGAFGPLPSKKDLKNIRHEEASLVYSADGKLIGKFYAENRTNVAFDNLPGHLVEALIATEDIRFYEHEGVDNWAMLRVAIKTIILGDRSAGGGSTITQQLAKNLYGRRNFGPLTIVVNKTKEIILANRLENVYEKNEIIQLYLNTVPFGEDIYGIGTASYRYFNKHVQDLTIPESATLVGMLKANTYYNPHLNPENALARRNVVIHQMAKYDYLDEEKADSLQELPLNTKYANLSLNNPNGYFLERVENQVEQVLSVLEKPEGGKYDLKKDGLEITTTLNHYMQQLALNARKRHLRKLQRLFNRQWPGLLQSEPAVQNLFNQKIRTAPAYRRLKQKGLKHGAIMDSLRAPRKMLLFNWEEPTTQKISVIDSISYYLKMLHSSVFAMDPGTGAVKVYIGGNSYSFLPYDLVLSQRQAASTFKPFIYTAAISQGMAPCEWVDNEPKVYSEYSDWTPQNYDDSKGGYYSVKGALAKSMNVPTVAIYFATGHEAVEATSRAFGFSADLPMAPSVALGSESVSLYEMVRGYAVFANGGKLVDPIMIQTIKDANGKVIYRPGMGEGEKILEKETATIMQQMLKGVVDSGTAYALRGTYGLGGEWGGKTGTSQNYGDAWFIGFNPNLVAGVWVGARYPAVHFTSGMGTGSQAALPIFGKMVHDMQHGHLRNVTLAEFPEPSEAILAKLDCPFYREERGLEKIEDFFERIRNKLFGTNKSDKNRQQDKKKERKGFFRRLFGRDED